MRSLHHLAVKHSFTTHAVPPGTMAGYIPLSDAPRIGDLALAEVISLGKHTTLEDRAGVTANIFPADLLIGAFGNRYATDQYEGYVPEQLVHECDMLSIGGVIGQVASRHALMSAPTRLRLLGSICDQHARALSLREFSLPARNERPQEFESESELILVVGASMNSGKTTTVGTLARALQRAGLRVAAAKITGTAAGKDGRFFASSGASPVLDFTDAGYPSTYLLSLEELTSVYRTLLGQLRATKPDYIVVEIADGIFQRETRMLLESSFRSLVDHVFFAANDSLSAECGVRFLKKYNAPLRAISGAFTQSPLAMREAEEATGVPCLNIEKIMAGEALRLLKAHRQAPARRVVYARQVA
jgi:hypothetical protein